MSASTILSVSDLRVELQSRRGSFVLTADALDLHAREALVILGPKRFGQEYAGARTRRARTPGRRPGSVRSDGAR